MDVGASRPCSEINSKNKGVQLKFCTPQFASSRPPFTWSSRTCRS